MAEEDTEHGARVEAIAKIAGKHLSSVNFIMDYVQLGFDSCGWLTCLVWPEVIESNSQYTLGSAGYRDRLCALIGQTSISAEFDDDETIHIVFGNEVKIRVPLRCQTRLGERGLFNGGKNYLVRF